MYLINIRKILFVNIILLISILLFSCKKKYYDHFAINNIEINENERYIILDIDRKELSNIDIDGYNNMHSISVAFDYDEKSHLYKNSNNKELESLDSISIDDRNSFYQPEEYNFLGKFNLNLYLDDVKQKVILPIIEGKELKNINIDGEVADKNSKLIISARGLTYDKELKVFTTLWILGDYLYE